MKLQDTVQEQKLDLSVMFEELQSSTRAHLHAINSTIRDTRKQKGDIKNLKQRRIVIDKLLSKIKTSLKTKENYDHILSEYKKL